MTTDGAPATESSMSDDGIKLVFRVPVSAEIAGALDEPDVCRFVEREVAQVLAEEFDRQFMRYFVLGPDA